MRTIWKGHLSFGLISVPVGLYAALEASERVSFRLLHRKDHSPIEYRKYCSSEGVEVPNDEIVKGYEVEKNRFSIVEKEELEKMQEEAGGGSDDHTIADLKRDAFEVGVFSWSADRGHNSDVLVTLNDGETNLLAFAAPGILCDVALVSMLVGSADSR